MKFSILISLSFLFLAILTSCKKDVEANTISNPTEQDKPVVYEGVRFSAINFLDNDQSFSTFDTSFKTPIQIYQLLPQQKKNVDILYIHDYLYDEPGFMDPYTAAQEWYWNSDIYYHPELDSSVKTIFYVTNLNKLQFDSVKSNSTFFDKYFTGEYIHLAPHDIFPPGSCIGGRGGYSDLKRGRIFAFKNEFSGKRGFLYIRDDQENGWPDFAVNSFSTKVDITKEK